VARSVNMNNQVVGSTVPCTEVNGDDSCDGPIYHSFLWENGSLVDLQTLVQSNSGVMIDCPACGFGAYNINDRGEIAGTGMLSNGDMRAFLLIPCDEQHPGMDGCDYSMVDAAAAAARSTARPYVPSTTQDLSRSRWSNRYHMRGLQSTSK